MGQRKDKLKQEALAFTAVLAEQYFIQRELDALPQFMDKQISWIGTGEDEIRRNMEEAKNALEQEMKEYAGGFHISDQWFEAVAHTDNICVVYGSIHTVPEDPLLSEDELRISLVVEHTEEGMKLLHLHLSHPDKDQEQGRYFVPKEARANTQDLRRKLDLRSRQIDILNSNIPGGAHQCKNDPTFTLISVSNSFLSMFGYTREEVETQFHNRFIEMVYPGDRPLMLMRAQEQLKHGREIELEYRVMCKDGQSVWVLEKAHLIEDVDGTEYFYCLLMEITERRQAQEELRLTLERHQVIMDQATDIIFEWDIRKDTLHFSPNWHKKFGYNPIDTEVSEKIPLSNNIHPDDISTFITLMKDTAAGTPYTEAEFRIGDICDQYRWCRIRATAQFDSEGHAIKAVGVIVDIDDERKQKQALLDMAMKDTLTGLYNKAAINSLVEHRMAAYVSQNVQALMILDIDNFKMVNDTYGHLTGDSLLSKVAATIKANIRTTDLAGRIGGDEFLIYLPEVTSKEITQEKAEKLLAALTSLTPEPGAAPITCSIGAAVFPHGSIDYYKLYEYADLALYARKDAGRKGVTFYQHSI